MMTVSKMTKDKLCAEVISLRREVEALVELCAANIDCGSCPADSSPVCCDYPTVCELKIRAWAKQQAAMAGKEGGQ